MSEFDTSVAMDETMEMPADDAQAAETISAEALAAELLNGKSAEETAVDTGVGDQSARAQEQAKAGQQGDNKRGDQIRAALRQQRRTIFETELGESEETVRELIRAHRAEKLTKEDPDITPKAARKIIEAQEKAAQPKADKNLEAMTAAVQTLIDDGWTADELQAFVADEEAQADMAAGRSVRQAARAFEKRQTAPKTRKQSVPTIRTPATSGARTNNLIDDMSDEEFARFSERAYQELMAGKKVTFD